ncbi:MAG TPA: alpha/beta fold hydrolase [Tepidisphaeraceae bacterium]|nr:alpha/beta fold hydrolase [Tepidisphaeraceae bacterium]
MRVKLLLIIIAAAAAWVQAAQAADPPIAPRDIRQRMQDLMGPLPDRSQLPPLDLQTAETFQGDGYRRMTVSFANLFEERVTAYLYVPDGLKPGERRPGVLALQSTGMQGKEIVDGRGPRGASRAYGLELARRGYVVIAPDYPSFGEQKDYDFANSRYGSGTMKAISDNLRCVDLLQLRDDVDRTKIAVIGHSLGGHNALFTAGFDERLKVIVTSCGWTPFGHYYGGKKLANWAQERYMPRMTSVYANDPDRIPFDFPELIASIAPRAVFSNSPVKDENFDVEGVRLGSAQIKKAYERLGVADRFVLRTPDYAHDFTDDTRREAYRFIDEQLGFKPGSRSGALRTDAKGLPVEDHSSARSSPSS